MRRRSEIEIPFVDLKRSHQPLRKDFDRIFRETVSNSRFILGEALEAFEKEYGNYLGGETRVVGVGNGTDAIEVALRALELPHGSEVLVPANSFISSAIGVQRAGLRAKFVDPNSKSLLVDADSFRRHIGPNTSCLMVVHLYGHVAPMGAILQLASETGLKVIEDAAQSHGASYQFIPVGCLGDVGATSFYPGKNLGAFGDGGAVLTRSQAIEDKARLLRNLGSTTKYQHESYGFNSRLDTLQAGVLSIKLKHLTRWNAQRERAVEQYDHLLQPVPQVIRPTILQDTQPAYHLYPILVDQRNELQSFLNSKRIQTLVHYPRAIPDQPQFKRQSEANPEESFEISQIASKRLLSLPLFPGITEKEIHQVATTVRAFLEFRGN